MQFSDKLLQIQEKNNSLLCLGLDPEIEKLPAIIKYSKEPLFNFNKAIIDMTADLVCAYKPNSAFYEALGINGFIQLKKTISYLKEKHSDIPVVLDVKRGDIGNTNRLYAKAAFEECGADAVTVQPYLGLDSLIPFLEYKDKLTIILVRTSNPDAKMFQDLKVDNEPLYLKIAQEIKKWTYGNMGIFVGATYPHELKITRSIFPDKIFLSAGMGAQSADVEKAVRAGVDKNGAGIMFNVSRSILYAGDKRDFAKKARRETKRLRDLINQYRF